MRRATILTTVLAILVAAALPSTASAVIRVGIGEQWGGVFTSPQFSAMKFKRARLFIPWNAARVASDRRNADAWLRGARAARVQPLVSFTAASGSRCPKRPCKLPSVRQFKRAFRAFRREWPWVRTISPWNEANHRSQPTFKRPDMAARYFNVVRKSCRRCTIVAADVIDERNMVRWLRKFQRVARGERLWGLHNYRDTNPRRGQRFGGTRRLLRTVRGPVWLTETGGIVKFVLPNGKTLFPESERRANKAVGRMFRLAKRYRKRIKRLYVYHWQQAGGPNRFDAGLLRADGSRRPAFRTVQRWLRGRWFSP